LGLHQVPTKLADLQIAGIALAYNLELATRNVGDFSGLGITLINPWEA
jgi:predicted nucleic acid-binding protein